MRALRRRFVVVGLVLLVPVALLVWRALSSVAVERRTRHEVVAERLFDEMERTLSDLLTREEARPFAAYGSDPASALPASSNEPFVVGHFQIDPQGMVRAAEAVRAIVAAPADGGNENQLLDQVAQGSVAIKKEAPVEDEKLKVKSKDSGTAYDALRSLNRAVEQRALRQKKMADDYREQAPSVGRKDSARPEEADAEEGGAALARPLMRHGTPELPPMVGQASDPRHQVLYRTVVRNGQAYRQGVVLDVARLGEWLREQVLGDSELQSIATITVGTAEASAPTPTDAAFVFDHNFAEPFGGLQARVALRPLHSLRDAEYVYALSAFLIVALAMGLWAVYRMAAVAIAFSERRSNFVAAVSHELKTPLTAIRMYGEMLRDGIVASDAKRDEYYRHITAESERLSRLINNVLEFAKLENGTRAVALTVGPVAPVIEEAVTLLTSHAEAAGFRLRTEVAPHLPPARFERDALLQVLFNVVDNATKYAAGATHPEIVLHVRRVEEHVVVTIRDHGPGVPIAHLGRIFEPFYRGEQELTRRRQGTGLGLALVQGLLDAMGATVHGRNAIDGGFEVEIALAAGPSIAASQAG